MFLGIIWRTCGSKCRGEGGGIFLTLCVKCCLVYFCIWSESLWVFSVGMHSCILEICQFQWNKVSYQITMNRHCWFHTQTRNITHVNVGKQTCAYSAYKYTWKLYSWATLQNISILNKCNVCDFQSQCYTRNGCMWTWKPSGLAHYYLQICTRISCTAHKNMLN